jgi:hypothetical protein
MGLFDKLDNLQDLNRLDELQGLQKLDQLEHLDKLDKLENLKQLEHLNKLDKLVNLNQLQQMQSLEPLNKLDQVHHLQELSKLQHLDKLVNMQELSQLQNLSMLKQMEHLQQLHHLNRLQQLQMMQRLEKLERLNQLPQLQELRNLSLLSNTSHLDQLSKLSQLDKLDPLNRLGAIDRAWDFNYASLLYLSSIIVPGLIFQETITIFLKERLGARRAIVLMAVYNVLTLFLCLNFVYNRLTLNLLTEDPLYYYSAWFCVILLFPFLLGWLVAFLMNKSALGSSIKKALIQTPAKTVPNAWDRFLTEAESYRVVITLKDDKKIMGTFSRGMAVPETSNPNDLYVDETSHYDPTVGHWKELEKPVGIWVKGTEIKMVEVTPQA